MPGRGFGFRPERSARLQLTQRVARLSEKIADPVNALPIICGFCGVLDESRVAMK